MIWGERDPALSVGLLDGLSHVAPRHRVARLPEAGHWVQNEAPEKVTAAIIEFLRSDDRT